MSEEEESEVTLAAKARIAEAFVRVFFSEAEKEKDAGGNLLVHVVMGEILAVLAGKHFPESIWDQTLRHLDETFRVVARLPPRS